MVRFFGGLAPLLAPGRGTYGSVWSAAFQRCKKRAKILKWRQMRAFSGSVSDGVVRPCGCCPAPARFLPGSCPAAGSCPVAARLLPGSCPVPARRPGRNRLGRAVPAQEPGSNRRTTLGCCTTLVRTLPRHYVRTCGSLVVYEFLGGDFCGKRRMTMSASEQAVYM